MRMHISHARSQVWPTHGSHGVMAHPIMYADKRVSDFDNQILFFVSPKKVANIADSQIESWIQ